MVGILVSFWETLFSGAFAVSFREGKCFYCQEQTILFPVIQGSQSCRGTLQIVTCWVAPSVKDPRQNTQISMDSWLTRMSLRMNGNTGIELGVKNTDLYQVLPQKICGEACGSLQGLKRMLAWVDFQIYTGIFIHICIFMHVHAHPHVLVINAHTRAIALWNVHFCKL